MSLQVVYIFSKIYSQSDLVYTDEMRENKTITDNYWSQASSFSNYSISLFFMDFNLFPFGVRYIPLGCRRLCLVPLSFISLAQTIIAITALPSCLSAWLLSSTFVQYYSI